MTAPTEYYTLGSWNSLGVPNYLDSVTNISPDIINRIISALPEQANQSKNSSTYLTSSSATNILIQSKDSKFSGADVYVTFLYEGAGYNNVIGYYVYDLNGDYTVPTKRDSSSSSWKPMTTSEINAVDSNKKSVIKKTIIFPNASLPTWANSSGKNGMAGGGNLLPGSKVRLVYDTKNPDKLFPNNVGIGFFVIPNGWNGGNVINRSTLLYTDSTLNPGGLKQMIKLTDLSNTTTEYGTAVISFEDISRVNGAGDSDFNDVVIMVTYTPSTSVDVGDALILPNGTAVNDDEIICDRTGIYVTMTDKKIAEHNKLSNKEYTFEFNIKSQKQKVLRMKEFKEIISKMKYSNSTSIQFENDNCDRGENDDDATLNVKLTMRIDKKDLQKYMYYIKAIDNIGETSPVNSNKSLLADFQNYFTIPLSDYKFGYVLCGINDRNVKTTYTTNEDTTPLKTNLSSPYAMGDPHITTIYGEKINIPDKIAIYRLYNDSELNVNVRLNYFPNNKNNCVLEHLPFMHMLGITCGEHKIVVNMFHPDTYYASDNEYDKIASHPFFNFLHENSVMLIAKPRKQKYAEILETTQFKLRYINFSTPNLGNVYIELLFIAHRCDTVNSIAMICDNMDMFAMGSGAFVNSLNVVTSDSLI